MLGVDTVVQEGGEQVRESRCDRKLDERGACPLPARALATFHLGATPRPAPRSGQGNSKTFHGKARANPFREHANYVGYVQSVYELSTLLWATDNNNMCMYVRKTENAKCIYLAYSILIF